MRENLTDYFQRATGARSVRAIAQAAGLDQSTLNRQLTGANTVTVETIVAICRAFDLDFSDAFVAAGFITPEEADRLGARIGMAVFTDLELARWIWRSSTLTLRRVTVSTGMTSSSSASGLE